jgi:hypothetical protein
MVRPTAADRRRAARRRSALATIVALFVGSQLLTGNVAAAGNLVPEATVPASNPEVDQQTVVAPTHDAFFFDGWAGTTNPGKLGSVSGPGTVTAVMDAPHSYLFVEAQQGATYWNLQLIRRDGSAIGVGTYSSPDELEFWINGDCAGPSSLIGSITIQSLTVSGDGTVQELTASFDYKCTSTNPPPMFAHGEVRIGSSSPYQAIAVTPQRIGYPSIDHDFGTVNVGSTSASWAVAVTNTGTDALDVGGSTTGDSAFTIQPGSCAGSLLAGASCNLIVAFLPTLGGATTGRLHLLTPGLGITDRAFDLAATGYASTSTTISVDPLDDGGVPGAATYRMAVSPVNALGWTEITRTCGATLSSGGWWFTQPGSCTATALFHGGAGFASSSSAPLTFVMPTTSSVVMGSDFPSWPQAEPLTITASAQPGNGPQPTIGSITIVDETTSTTLITAPISAADHTVSVTIATLTPGTHDLRATYSGGGGILGSSKTIPQDIVIDTYPPDGNLLIPARTSSATITIQTPAVDLPVDVVASLAVSNDGVHWDTRDYVASLDWSLTNPATGGVDIDGVHVVYAKWQDRAGNWSAAATRSTTLDRTAPSGSLSIASGAASTRLTSVALAVPATDDLTGVTEVALSNDGSTWTARPYAASQSWTLSPGDGTKSVWAKWSDGAGNWSDPLSDTIVLDTVAPSGAVSIAGGANTTGTATVTVDTAATDTTSGVSEVALSNDGATWSTLPYAASLIWTLSPGDGTKTVWAKWRDAAGNWSAPASDTIVLDTVGPTVSAPANALIVGSSMAGGRASIRFGWTGYDTAALGQYQFALSTDGGGFATVAPSLTSPTISLALAAGHTYRAAVRAIDGAGNVGAWAYGPAVRLSAYQESSRSIHWLGTWHTGTSGAYWGGHDRYASGAGAKASLTFSGRSFAWVGSVGPTRGWAKVYVNGVLARSINLSAARNANQRILFATTWSSARSRTVTIRISGTAGHPRGDVDAFIVGS